MGAPRNFHRGLTAAILICCAWSAAAPDFQSPWRKRNRPSADPSRTARFLPAEIQIRDPSQGALWRTLAAGLPRDSTRHWELRGDRLRISYDMLQDLAGGNLPNTGGALGDRAAAWLARSHGDVFRSSGSAFGAYLPDDEWLLTSPQWSLHNTGAPFGDRPGKAGVDIGIEKVWDKFGGSDSLVVAVVDAGFDFRHPDLKGRNWINKAEAEGQPGLDDDAKNALVKKMAALLEAEDAAYDVAGYRDAPPGLRVWCGGTVDTADIEALGPWLDWAWSQARVPA